MFTASDFKRGGKGKMAIYDANTRKPIESPDLSLGYLVDGTIVTSYTTEVFPDTVTENRPNGIRKRVPVTEPCQYYHKYTQEELAAQHPPDTGGGSDEMATWDELAAAYNEGVMQV